MGVTNEKHKYAGLQNKSEKNRLSLWVNFPFKIM